MSEAKAAILARIRAAGVVPAASLPDGQPSGPSIGADRIVDRFAEYCADYRANVVRVSGSHVAEEIVRLLAARGSTRVVIPADFPADLRPPGVDLTEDKGFDNLALDGFQAVVTTCAVAVAETGTIVLDAGPGQGRRALTLIPDHHVCVVFESQVVESVPEAVAFLEGAVKEGRPLTWISGPSATSDIELDRVEGVHGPRNLDVILVK